MKTVIDMSHQRQYLVSGKRIHEAVSDKNQKLQVHLDGLLDKLSELPKDVQDVAMVCMLMFQENPTDPRVVAAQAYAKEAAQVTKTMEELARAARNIDPADKLMLNESDLLWFGL